MCGKETRLFKAEIEGSMLNVCEACSRHGKVISTIKEPVKGKKEEKSKAEAPTGPELILSVVPDYNEIIKSKREQLGLNQEDFAKKLNEKVSIIHKIETGHFKPGLESARKLEKILRIKLIEQIELKEEKKEKIKSDSFTIGDFIKV